jgi:hypothetical protein
LWWIGSYSEHQPLLTSDGYHGHQRYSAATNSVAMDEAKKQTSQIWKSTRSEKLTQWNGFHRRNNPKGV